VAPAFLKARQTKYAAYATLYVVVVFAIISVANVLANRYNKSYDSTSNKRYSLSEQTAKIVKGLKEPATITYYDQSTHFQTAKDQLDQYANLSPKIHVEYVDPDKKPQLAREAGIKNYGTTIVQIGAKKEEAKSLVLECEFDFKAGYTIKGNTVNYEKYPYQISQENIDIIKR